ncbi:MAG: DUF5106 domain-containing protein [Bacteroidales bacterium]|nr:DUF5106 domain-containing protein [Bacteroidales bacterium]
MQSRISKYFMVLVVLLGFVPSASAGTDLFVYPTAPDSITHLQRRCDYIVSRFWDRCNFEVAMLHKDKFNTAFGDWVNIMPHASADTVYNSISRLMNRFPKNPDVVLQLGQMAEEWVYSDTSQIYSEDIFLPFAQAVRDHKKIGKADKARFARNAKIIESSRVGAKLPDIEFIRPDGTRGNLGEIKSGSVLLFFNHPDCSDCNMARIRLDVDFNTNALLDRGELTIVSIYPEEPDSAWKEAAKDYNDKWVVVAMPDADEFFDMQGTPKFVFLNSRHKVLAKDMGLDYLLGAFQAANTLKK